MFYCNPRAYPYHNPTLTYFAQILPIKRLCEKRNNKKKCSLVTEYLGAKKSESAPPFIHSTPEKWKKSAEEKLFSTTCVDSYVLLSLFIVWRHFAFEIEAFPPSFLGGMVFFANEESALRRKTTPLQSGSLVSKFATKKANHWAQTSKRVLHFVRQYSRAFAASFRWFCEQKKSPSTLWHRERCLWFWKTFLTAGCICRYMIQKKDSLASESPAAEFRVFSWHLVELTGSHSSKWGALLVFIPF